MLSVNTNISAIAAHRDLQSTTNMLNDSMEKLSSGLRINKAADDAAGLGIAEKMTAQIGGLDQAQRNAQDGVSLVQTAEGVLGTVQDMLNRVRELAVQFNNGTLSTADQASITAEVAQLCAEIQNIGTDTAFNGISLLTGTSTITLQVGANDGETLTFSVAQLFGGAATKVNSNIFNFSGTVTLASIDAALDNVSQLRGTFGALQNRLSYKLQGLSIYEQNLTASKSQIMDVDMASEMSNFSKLQIMQQAGTAMLAQANQSPAAVLKLLG